MTFEELGLDQSILQAVTDLGFKEPTPIQEQTISLLLNNPTDVVALAQTGTGKTAAFGLPLLSNIDPSSKQVQALVLAPTRELCVQITNDLNNFSKYLKGIQVTAVYGGASIDNQIRDIRRGANVIAATPGRLVDLIERRAVDLSNVSIVVLDEADEMLNMGFKDSLDEILQQTPDSKHTWLFSATMPKEVERIARNYMSKPLEISVGKKNQGATNIEHLFYVVNQRDRYLALKRIADYYPEIFGIVFCRTKAETQEVADSLIKDGYSADALHGDLSQSQRDFVMKRFRNRTLQMLVATDVAARGIDVDSVTHVINYNLPEDVENYTHRSGRTARAGRSGISIAIVTPKDASRINELERIIGKKFTKALVPNGVEVCEKQLFHLVRQLHDVEVKDDEIEKYLPKIYEELQELSKEELIKRIVSEEFNRFYNYYENAPDLNPVKGGDGKGGSQGRTVRFFMNMGAMDGFNRVSLKEYLADAVRQHPRMIFNIDVKNSFSFFETESRFVDQFVALNKSEMEFNGRKIAFEVSNGRGGGSSEGGKPRGEKRSYGNGGGEKRAYGNGGGEKRSYGGNFNKEGGRSYGGNKEGRSFGGGREKKYGDRKEKSSRDKGYRVIND